MQRGADELLRRGGRNRSLESEQTPLRAPNRAPTAARPTLLSALERARVASLATPATMTAGANPFARGAPVAAARGGPSPAVAAAAARPPPATVHPEQRARHAALGGLSGRAAPPAPAPAATPAEARARAEAATARRAAYRDASAARDAERGRVDARLREVFRRADKGRPAGGAFAFGMTEPYPQEEQGAAYGHDSRARAPGPFDYDDAFERRFSGGGADNHWGSGAPSPSPSGGGYGGSEEGASEEEEEEEEEDWGEEEEDWGEGEEEEEAARHAGAGGGAADEFWRDFFAGDAEEWRAWARSWHAHARAHNRTYAGGAAGGAAGAEAPPPPARSPLRRGAAGSLEAEVEAEVEAAVRAAAGDVVAFARALGLPEAASGAIDGAGTASQAPPPTKWRRAARAALLKRYHPDKLTRAPPREQLLGLHVTFVLNAKRVA